jgi:hypothetical protein
MRASRQVEPEIEVHRTEEVGKMDVSAEPEPLCSSDDVDHSLEMRSSMHTLPRKKHVVCSVSNRAQGAQSSQRLSADTNDIASLAGLR